MVAAALVVASIGGRVADPPATTTRPPAPAVRILLVGDVMLGRGVADVASLDPSSIFADVAPIFERADLTLANLESPLTARDLLDGVANDLRADPVTARLLAGAGFDVATMANNHAGDAGLEGVADTVAAADAAGLVIAGVGTDARDALAPIFLEAAGVTVAIVAADATGASRQPRDPHPDPDPGPDPGAAARHVVAAWDDDLVAGAITSARDAADVVIMSLHAGAEYLDVPDRDTALRAARLVDLGVDVVWGHGAHVRHPIEVVGAHRFAVVATSLGNLLFDRQLVPGTGTGTVLEVLAGADGVVAMRTGTVRHAHGRVGPVTWDPPVGDAVAFDDGWFDLLATPRVEPMPDPPPVPGIVAPHDVVAVASGDVDVDGLTETVVSFRRPARPTALQKALPTITWIDRAGRSAHLGVYTSSGAQRWVAGSVARPVAALAVCDGAVALVHDSLDDQAIMATGAWWWNGFGFDELPDLPGAGTAECADVDGDGDTEPIVTGRS